MEYPGVVVGVAVVLLNKFWSLWNFVSGLMSDPWIDETGPWTWCRAYARSNHGSLIHISKGVVMTARILTPEQLESRRKNDREYRAERRAAMHPDDRYEERRQYDETYRNAHREQRRAYDRAYRAAKKQEEVS